MLQNVLDGDMRRDDFTAELWKEESPKQKETQASVKSFGKLVSVTLVDRSAEGGKRSYRYRLEFEKNTLLQRFVFDEQNKLAVSSTRTSNNPQTHMRKLRCHHELVEVGKAGEGSVYKCRLAEQRCTTRTLRVP